jgi:cyclic-di-AMP phosphodiesterase PgpH
VSDASKTTAASEARDALPPASTQDPLKGPRAELAKVIPRRPRVTWWLGILLAASFALLAIPSVTAHRWLGTLSVVERGLPAPYTVRVPPFAGYDTAAGHTGGGGVLIARGEVADRDTAEMVRQIDDTRPHGPLPYVAFLLLVGVLTGLFTHHTRRSTYGRLLRVQLVSLTTIIVLAIAVKAVMLTTSLSVLVVPVALLSMVPTLVLDRVVGLATGTLAALVVALLVPFDVGVAVMLMVQAGAAGLVIAERPKKRLRAVLIAGAAATLFTAATYPLMLYLTTGRFPIDELAQPAQSAWLAAAAGPALATVLALFVVPVYQLLVGEITHGKLVELEDLSHPLLKQIANKAPGTWQHSLMMANMAELAANAIGANGRLVRVGAYFHDLGKSLQPKYFIENLEPGETSPHDKLPPDVSCDAIFAHVTEGIVAARRAGLHERIIDFMHMHHGNGVLEYFWGKCREHGNPKELSVEHFRYPGVPPQSRETAILSICDAVEAASRTLKKPDVSAIDNLVQRIVYGKLHLGQLDDSGLSMSDLRRVAESLRDTIKHANHGRIEYPWQKAQQDASASADQDRLVTTGPRLDSLDRPARPDTVAAAAKRESADALAVTDSAAATPNLRAPRDSSELATRTTAPVARPGDTDADRSDRPVTSTAERAAQAQAWRAAAAAHGMDLSAEHDLKMMSEAAGEAPGDARNDGDAAATTRHAKEEDVDGDDVVELRQSKPKLDPPQPMPADLAAAASTRPLERDAHESDPRMCRVTNPLEVADRPSAEAVQFAAEAKHALTEATKDLAAVARPPAEHEPAAARKRAATLQPLKTPTVPPPLGRRSPTGGQLVVPAQPGLTVPPPDTLRPPAVATGPSAPLSDTLRPPAFGSQPAGIERPPSPGVTAPPPVAMRPPGPNLLDDMITLRPQYEARGDLVVERADDGSVTIEPGAPRASHGDSDDAVITRPRMLVDPGDTMPSLEMPLRAPPSAPAIPVVPATAEDSAESSWVRGLAARLDAQIEQDFGAETPASPPTRAELQALSGSAPDVTRQQSLDELEALQRQTRREHDQVTRRAPYPTAEVDDADIEAAIELAPPARRNALGIAKKPKD